MATAVWGEEGREGRAAVLVMAAMSGKGGKVAVLVVAATSAAGGNGRTGAAAIRVRGGSWQTSVMGLELRCAGGGEGAPGAGMT